MHCAGIDPNTEQIIEAHLRNGWQLRLQLRDDWGGNGHGGMCYRAEFVKREALKFTRNRFRIVRRHYADGATPTEAITAAVWQVR